MSVAEVLAKVLPMLDDLSSAVVVTALRWTPVGLASLLVARLARSTAAVFRHAVWVAALLALALMLPASALLPHWRVSVEGKDTWQRAREAALARLSWKVPGESRQRVEGRVLGGAAQAEGVPASRPRGTAWPRLIGECWLAGAVCLLLREGVQRARGRRLLRGSTPLAEVDLPGWRGSRTGRRRVALRAAAVRVPGVMGILRPTVFLPHGWHAWPRAWREAALAHEAAHVERGDLSWQLLARCLRAIFWFHPAVWLAGRELGAEAERACDERVVESGFDRVAYAEVLVEIATVLRTAPLPAPALAVVGGGRPLLRRVRGLLAGPARPRRKPRRAWLTPLGLLALLLASGDLVLRASLPAVEGGLPLERASSGNGWLLRCSAGDVVCANATHQAVRLLRGSPRGGVALLARVDDGRVDGYASLGGDGGLRPAVPRMAPGSLAKVALAAAWWESGLNDIELACPSFASTASGMRVHNNGAVRGSLRAPHDMLVFSCNSAAVTLAGALAERRGRGALPAAMAPLLAADAMAPTAPDIAALARSQGVDWQAQAVGIGPLVTSPLEVARLVQAVGNGGVATAPWAAAAAGARAEPRRLFAARTAELLRDAFVDAVRRGTATQGAEVLRGAPWRLGGKTGTVANEDGTLDGWFAGLADDVEGRPQRVVVVWLRGAGPGGVEATRLAARLVRAIGG